MRPCESLIESKNKFSNLTGAFFITHLNKSLNSSLFIIPPFSSTFLKKRNLKMSNCLYSIFKL